LPVYIHTCLLILVDGVKFARSTCRFYRFNFEF